MNQTLKTWFTSQSLSKQALIIAIVIGIAFLTVSAVVRHFQVSSQVNAIVNKYEEKKEVLEKDNAAKDIQITSYKLSEQVKENQIKILEQKVFTLEGVIQESNKRLEKISDDVKKADTAYERAKLEKSINNTQEDACAALRKAGLSCE